MSMTATIKTKVGIYKTYSTHSKKVGTYKKGEKVTVSSIKNDSSGNSWAKTKDGYFMYYKKSSKAYHAKIVSKTKNANGKTVTSNVTKMSTQYKSLMASLATTTNNGKKLNRTMQLFGLPYQFLPSVDCRVDNVSDLIGRKYIERIILDAPVVTIMPGKPTYLPGQKDKASITEAFIQAASGNLGALQTLSASTDINSLKFYDFKTAYIEYMRYVNILCRTGASFLELQGTSKKKNKIDYKINGAVANFMNYDWKDYRWNGSPYSSTIGSVAKKTMTDSAFSSVVAAGGTSLMNFFTGKSSNSSKYKVVTNKKKKKKSYEIESNHLNINDSTSKLSDAEESTAESILRNVHYVQFYCDPSSDVSESMENSTKESALKTTLSGMSDTVKDVAFMLNSGGVDSDKVAKMGNSLIDFIGGGIGKVAGSVNDSAGSLASRLTSTAKNIVKGENVVMPDIYSNSSYTKSYQITIPLKALYGNKYSYYTDVYVPYCHCLALVLPKATNANTYAAPMLVKCFIRGKFTCNMGIVTSLAVDHNTEARNVDGLNTEMTVTLNITDLYSDLSMTPASNPILFTNNTSLIEFLAINCGLDLVEPQFMTKVKNAWNNLSSAITDVGDNIVSGITEEMDGMIYKLTGL